jgi:NAD(P)H-dependent FMN reductase
MRLTVLNGSPRVRKSNTRILVEKFLEGFEGTAGNTQETGYLAVENDQPRLVEMFRDAETVLLAFPLYVDSLPAVVKKFIERLEPLCGRDGNPALGFIVQSGFPEAHHSRFVQRYLEKLCRRLGCRCLGVVVRGGVEGIRVRPRWMTGKLFRLFRDLGAEFGRSGEFDPDIVKKIAGPEKLSAGTRLLFRVLGALGVTNIGWNSQLKKNGAFERRYARPYDHTTR